MIETHCHLNYLKQDTPEELVQRAREAGIEKMICISVEPPKFQEVLDWSKTDDVYATIGLHPHHASEWRDEFSDLFEGYYRENSKVVAIGEIGLDYHYNHAPPEKQKEVFHRQRELARNLKAPIVIHSRDCDDDMLEALVSDPLADQYVPGVLHSFTGSSELALKAIQRGYYIGFNGIITFKNAENVRQVAAAVPVERILLETDSPFLAPVPKRGKENSPANLIYVAKKLAEIKKVSLDELIETTTSNAQQVFPRLRS